MMDEGCQLSEWMTRLVAMNTAKQYHVSSSDAHSYNKIIQPLEGS